MIIPSVSQPTDKKLHRKRDQSVKWTRHNRSIVVVVSEVLREQLAVHEHLGVSDDEQAESGSSDGDVKTSRVIKETDGIGRVGTHTRVNDIVLLSSLIRVHGGDFDVAQFRLLKEVHQQDLLSGVGCDHADAVLRNLLRDEHLDEIKRSHSLIHVDVGRSSVSDGLLSLHMPEEERTRFVGIRDGSEDGTLLLLDSVL